MDPNNTNNQNQVPATPVDPNQTPATPAAVPAVPATPAWTPSEPVTPGPAAAPLDSGAAAMPAPEPSFNQVPPVTADMNPTPAPQTDAPMAGNPTPPDLSSMSTGMASVGAAPAMNSDQAAGMGLPTSGGDMPGGPSLSTSPTPGPTPSETAPTDLSQLAAALGAPAPIPSAPTSSAPAQGTASAAAHPAGKGIPKVALIALAVILLLAAVGASAYFILGIGKSAPENTTSLPATQQPLTNPPQAAAPTAVPDVPATQSASPSSLGGVVGASSSAQASGSATSGSSALQLLKARQGQ